MLKVKILRKGTFINRQISHLIVIKHAFKSQKAKMNAKSSKSIQQPKVVIIKAWQNI